MYQSSCAGDIDSSVFYNNSALNGGELAIYSPLCTNRTSREFLCRPSTAVVSNGDEIDFLGAIPRE